MYRPLKLYRSSHLGCKWLIGLRPWVQVTDSLDIISVRIASCRHEPLERVETSNQISSCQWNKPNVTRNGKKSDFCVSDFTDLYNTTLKLYDNLAWTLQQGVISDQIVLLVNTQTVNHGALQLPGACWCRKHVLKLWLNNELFLDWKSDLKACTYSNFFGWLAWEKKTSNYIILWDSDSFFSSPVKWHFPDQFFRSPVVDKWGKKLK